VHIDASITPFFGARYFCKGSECVGKAPCGVVDAHTSDIAKTGVDGHPKKNKTGIQEIWCRAT
jgi:hypothetical protein